MRAEAGIGVNPDWRQALATATAQMTLPESGEGVDLALLFASQDYMAQYPDLLAEVRRLTGARCLAGCSGQGVIGPGREVEHEAGLALQLFSLPGARLQGRHISQTSLSDHAALSRELVSVGRANAWLLFADPFSLDTEALLQLFSESLPGLPLVGGLASGSPRRQMTHVFLDGDCMDEGAVALAIGGGYTVRSVVSQGAAPIGEAWTITGATGNVLESIGMRPALDVLMDTFHALPREMQDRASRNLLVGLAMNEYKDEFGRGDFLIRNIMGIDRDSGVIAIGALPRVGQTVQFQIRDPGAADEDLHELLSQARDAFGDTQPVGALLCCCNGRGVGLFGQPDHDVGVVSDLMGSLPVAGFFCNGEIGPVGGKNFLHGFTASMAFIVPEGENTQR
jgi:small ligand-binding sensory domain FIST